MRLTRRDMLKLGIAVGGATVLPGGRLLADGGGQSGGLGSSPRTTPFVVELLPGRGIPPVAQPVAPFPTLPDPGNCVNVDGSTAFHVHGPRVVPANTEFFLMHERPVEHSFHPQLPPNVLWGYDGSIPGPTFIAKSGTPQLVRFVNDLPENDPVGIGDRFGQRFEGSSISNALVRPVLVVEGLELAQGVQQMPLVPDQGSIQ